MSELLLQLQTELDALREDMAKKLPTMLLVGEFAALRVKERQLMQRIEELKRASETDPR